MDKINVIVSVLMVSGFAIFANVMVMFLSVSAGRDKCKKGILSIITVQPNKRQILEKIILDSAKFDQQDHMLVLGSQDSFREHNAREIAELERKLPTFFQSDLESYFLEKVLSKSSYYGGQFHTEDRGSAYLQKLGLARELDNPAALGKIAQYSKDHLDRSGRSMLIFGVISLAIICIAYLLVKAIAQTNF